MGALNRVLIANRGEIAIRIARAAASLGLDSVGVYAPMDARSLHVHVVGDACELKGDDGPGAYLDGAALIDVALRTGCDAVHPGYGFLAESAGFAEQCAAAGLTFVGPPPDALRLLGDKTSARSLAQSVGVPVVPGSKRTLNSADEARAVAAGLGYPVMLKASAGGGGRGMREVATAADVAEAFERCASEARAAFGDGSLFLERLVHRPRHIEVQVLADAYGNTVHLYERDCSVQARHQKVIEVAPAPRLDAQMRRRILANAIALARAAAYVNAGTVEFLVAPETGEHFFLEANTRIQVEHTVTEEVTGIDLVEAQLRIAAGESLSSLGLAEQSDVPAPRGYAVEARVVVTKPGVITGYREPSGRGVRVDGAGYVGYAPPPQFDPLLAKVICSSASTGSFESALQRTARALTEFYVAGVSTNIAQLQAVLLHPEVRAADARTSLLEDAGLPDALPWPAGPTAFLDEQAAAVMGGRGRPGAAAVHERDARPTLGVEPGQQAVVSPVDASLVEFRVGVGDSVAAGEPLFVVSAMKMETLVPSPSAGVVSAVGDVTVGQSVNSGQVLVVLAEPSGGTAAGALASDTTGSRVVETWQPVLDEIQTLQRLAQARLAPGSDDPGVVRQRDRGKLTCRERLHLLLDEESFHEIGSVTGFASYDEDGRVVAFTPSNHIGGWGRVEGRQVVVCADDFTSRGGHADGAIGAKSLHLDQLSVELRVPSIRLLDGSSGGGSVAAMVPQQKRVGESSAKESSGAITAGRPRVTGGGGSFLPGHLGSTAYTEQLATVPVVNMLLGSVVGIGAAKAVLGHFSVMVRNIGQLFVAGPPVVQHAMGYDVSKEDLGGWHIHCRNGSVDNLAETEADAAAIVRRFLSYLPSSVHETPPVLPPDQADPPDRRDDELFTLIPRRRTTTFDIRQAIQLMADRGSFFEIGPLWGTDQVVGFVRFNGYPLGVLASDSQHANGGAMTADGCDKLRRQIDLCDLFHIPVLNLVDNPGFAVGVEHEVAGTIRRGGEWMVAFAQAEVPIFTVIMRRSFGVAGNNFATPRAKPSIRVVWPAADVGGIPPEGGIEAAYKRQLAEAEDPEALRAELNARIESARGPLGPLSRFQMEEMIDPRDTRRLVCEWVEGAYRVVAQLAARGGRAMQFRP